MRDSYRGVKDLGAVFRWKHGEHIAVLEMPDDAPITYAGPDTRGHVMLYGANGEMIVEEGAAYLLSCVVRVLHGPSHDE
ncbi:MAG: hypothetical protein IT305_33150 [Chloroflexi bacterium]|nr:hypothetical protein [Chloroflexota bacterium]